MVAMNDGKSFQTGCGFDPIDTGCCFPSYSNDTALKYNCFKCKNNTFKSSFHQIWCDEIVSRTYDYEHEVNDQFKEETGNIRLCGSQHNPSPYFVSEEPYALPEFSNRNYLSNLTSDRFLCNVYEWEQGDYTDDAGLANVIGVNANFGLQVGRHLRINHNNYQRDPINPNSWIYGAAIPGEGIYACYNKGWVIQIL